MRNLAATIGLALASMVPTSASWATVPEACAKIQPGSGDERRSSIEPLDLIQLRDIGYMHLASGQKLLALSPDRTKVAFLLHQASVDANRYCTALMLVDPGGDAPAKALDLGDELIAEPVSIRGVEVEYGYPTTIVPQWSPDGSLVAYLRKSDGVAQVFVVEIASGTVRQVTSSGAGAGSFAWSADGRSILYSDRPGLLAAKGRIEEEGQIGYLVDDRVIPYAGSKPAVPTPTTDRRQAVDLADGRVRELADGESERIDLAKNSAGASAAIDVSTVAGWKLEKRQTVAGSYISPTQLVATTPDGAIIECAAEACRGSQLWDIEGAWATERPGEFAFVRREGWAGNRYGIYLWRVGGQPNRLASVSDLLIGCEGLGAKLICARETSLQPRHLVTYDLRRGGKRAVVFEPNPEFSRLTLGEATRLEWRNASGQESFGDLVLPPLSKRAGKMPMIVVQYISRGFLRGGTGDEYPVQLLANAGYAVLNLQKPSPLFAIEKSNGTIEDVSRLMQTGWADRANIHSSLLTGIEAAAAKAPIDRERIGITGVSDGSTTTQYALINSPGLFKAASIGSCCVDPTSMMIYAGSAVARERRQWGFPPASGPGSGAWKPLALSMNAPERMVPLLMQLADNEFLISMETIAAYEQAGGPIEARIFPDEYHLKFQPRHRLAVYRRNIQWFDFWLAGIEHTDPVDGEQYRRWNAMRDNSAR